VIRLDFFGCPAWNSMKDGPVESDDGGHRVLGQGWTRSSWANESMRQTIPPNQKQWRDIY
jgi:hypothetical protein